MYNGVFAVIYLRVRYAENPIVHTKRL